VKHEWNVVIVNRYDLPRAPHKEFQVSSKNLLGATMKATHKIKKEHIGWKIKSVWRLDPNRLKRDVS